MKTKSRTSLVLMELIITILFFSICSAVCVQLFVAAHIRSIEAKELNCAVSKAQGFAEVMRGSDGSFESILAEYPEAIGDDETYFEVYYDKDFNETTDIENAKYVSDVTIDKISKIQNMEINVVKLDDYENIYSLTATKYIRK